MNSQDPIVIVSTARTPIGGMLGDLTPLAGHQLGSAAVKAAVCLLYTSPSPRD